MTSYDAIAEANNDAERRAFICKLVDTEAKLDTVYDQIADYMLQLSRLTFPHIGAISKDIASGEWNVTGRPLTYSMNDLVTSADYPAVKFPTAPFDRASDYFTALANGHLTHLQTQRNLATDHGDARRRFIARHRFAQLIPEHCVVEDDDGPFLLFGDDFRPANMLADPDTLRITAVIDWEFTNAMPAQFAHDPPWWLLLLAPHTWLARNNKKEFLARFVPRMEQFIRAVERVEARAPRSRASLRGCSFDIDDIYWSVLHRDDGASDEMLDGETCAQMEHLVQMKMGQLEAYWEEKHDARFAKSRE